MSQNRARDRNRDMERHERGTHTNAERQRQVQTKRMRIEENVLREETQRKSAGKRAGRALRIRGRGAGGNKGGAPPSNSPLAGVQSSGLTGNPVGSKLRLLKPQGQRRVEKRTCHAILKASDHQLL